MDTCFCPKCRKPKPPDNFVCCAACREQARVYKQTHKPGYTAPDTAEYWLCVSDESDIYRPGHLYEVSVITADIAEGVISADAFKPDKRGLYVVSNSG